MSAQRLVDAFYEAYNGHDVAAVVALYAADATHHEVAQERRAAGAQAIGAGLGHFLQAFPDAGWSELRRIVDGDAAAIAYRLTGTLAAPMGPFRTPGQRLDLQGIHVLEVAGDRIAASADYWDAATFARQMQGAR